MNGKRQTEKKEKWETRNTTDKPTSINLDVADCPVKICLRTNFRRRSALSSIVGSAHALLVAICLRKNWPVMPREIVPRFYKSERESKRIRKNVSARSKFPATEICSRPIFDIAYKGKTRASFSIQMKKNHDSFLLSILKFTLVSSCFPVSMIRASYTSIRGELILGGFKSS